VDSSITPSARPSNSSGSTITLTRLVEPRPEVILM
jgi:hypothetical protein